MLANRKDVSNYWSVLLIFQECEGFHEWYHEVTVPPVASILSLPLLSQERPSFAYVCVCSHKMYCMTSFKVRLYGGISVDLLLKNCLCVCSICVCVHVVDQSARFYLSAYMELWSCLWFCWLIFFAFSCLVILYWLLALSLII